MVRGLGPLLFLLPKRETVESYTIFDQLEMPTTLWEIYWPFVEGLCI